MRQYINLVKKVYEEGELVGDRTGTGTRRIFGHMMEFDCSEKFPLVTVKYTHYPAIIHELLWFISGSTNIKYLQDNNVKIWNEWATEEGDIGPLYGFQWRNSGGDSNPNYFHVRKKGVDQLSRVILGIKETPFSRRLIIDCWDPKVVPDDVLGLNPQENVSLGYMALAPCHMFMQFQVQKDKKLNLIMYQRSVDVFLGLPFNIASYALLLNMVAQVTGTLPGKFTWMGGDIHIYNNHIPQVDKMMERQPMSLPYLRLNPDISDISNFTFKDIDIVGYEYHSALKGEISV